MAKSRDKLAAAETARNAEKQRGLGKHEAGRVDQQHLREKPALTQTNALAWKGCSPRASGSSGMALRQPPERAS